MSTKCLSTAPGQGAQESDPPRTPPGEGSSFRGETPACTTRTAPPHRPGTHIQVQRPERRGRARTASLRTGTRERRGRDSWLGRGQLPARPARRGRWTGNRTCSATPTCCAPSPRPPPPAPGAGRHLFREHGRPTPTYLRESSPRRPRHRGGRPAPLGARRRRPGARTRSAAGGRGLSGKPQRWPARRLRPAPL